MVDLADSAYAGDVVQMGQADAGGLYGAGSGGGGGVRAECGVR